MAASHISDHTETAISAPIVRGSGVLVLHKALEAHIPGYRVDALSPYWGVVPSALAVRHRCAAAVTHSHPELGADIAHPDSSLVATFHNYYLDDEALATASWQQQLHYRTMLRSAIHASLRRARLITAVSRFTGDLVQRHHALGERLIVIPNGVDVESFSPCSVTSDGIVRILFAGNPIRRKGFEHLSALANALPDGTIMQCTAGLRDSAVRRINASDKLALVPRRAHAEMPALYRGADILFFPTRREGFGLVVAEAMACGLPIVATRCSSIPELVEHGKGGYLFDIDNRDQMLGYLMRLARDPGLRAEMGAFNRARIVERFTLSRMVSDYREIFRSVGSQTLPDTSASNLA